jgi:hypothetical protein
LIFGQEAPSLQKKYFAMQCKSELIKINAVLESFLLVENVDLLLSDAVERQDFYKLCILIPSE